MSFDKLTKLLPVCDFALNIVRSGGFGLEATRFGFALEPQVDGVTADIEDLTDFTFFSTIKFDGINHFLTKIFTVGFNHKI
jgi:hypothetical protein